ncbi:hypothetical protein OCU04_007542 [Sclerotinia nivalis]|uniref:Uncharacterized protein n=1 Tax=Sclerotinia nivalis TaxID=352851 RepID=A0A9X0DJ86_9HELO|nr:hypothetical protein OCU04_007542 [Sclerotinia nivalis]
MSKHIHELSHPTELHFYRLDEKKDHDERLALVAYDRDGGVRVSNGTVNCPAVWFDQNGRAHNRNGVYFRSAKSHGLIGVIHMPPCQTIDMIYRHAALWSVYTILGFELSKVESIKNPDDCKTTTKDSVFVTFINWLRLWLPKGFYIDCPDDWAYARLNHVSRDRKRRVIRTRDYDERGKAQAEKFTKAIYTGFHKVVEDGPEELFSVKDPGVMGEAAWDGTEAEEDRLVKRVERMVNRKLGLEDEEYDDLKSRWGDYGKH